MKAGGAEIVLRYVFSAEEFLLLDLFVEQCDALARCEWVQHGPSVSLSMSVENGRLSTKAQAPSEELASAVLHRMRPFLLEGEPASFLKVNSLVGKRIEDPFARALLKLLRQRFFGKELHSAMAITVTGASLAEPDKPINATLNSFAMLLDWLNAYEYHRDIEKRERLAGLTRMMSQEVARAIFLMMIEDAMAAIFRLGDLVAALAGHEQSAKLSGIRLPPPK